MFSNMSRAVSALKLASVAAVAATIVAAASACGDQSRTTAPRGASRTLSATPNGTYFGAPVQLAPGIARTYLKIENGAPVELGVEMDEVALLGRPSTGGGHGGHTVHNMRDNMFELPLPAEAGITAYKSVNIDWMANGHKPPYDRPHFDFHFYVIPTAERLAIDPADPQWAQKAGNYPPPEYWPARYYPLSILVNEAPAAVTVPQMGLHWLDVAAPELPPNGGAEFSHTLFYGSWNGAIIFDEPMITKKLLESRATVEVALPPAAKYSTTGYRAHGYRVYFDEASQRHRVALVQLATQE